MNIRVGGQYVLKDYHGKLHTITVTHITDGRVYWPSFYKSGPIDSMRIEDFPHRVIKDQLFDIRQLVEKACEE